jgi:SOS-response transcriptional repressor LexA
MNRSVQLKRAEYMHYFAPRIRGCRQQLGLNQTEFASQLGVSLRAVQLWESGAALPQPKQMRAISALLNLPIPWLLGEQPGPAPGGPFAAPGEASVRPGRSRRHAPLTPLKQVFPRRVPVVSWACAGCGGDFADLAGQINEWLDTDCADANAYALIIEGDSMLPEFKSGDRVVFLPNTLPQNGDVVVARLDKTGDVFLKLFHQTGPRGERVRLTSFNPAYPPLEYPLKEFRFIHPVHSLVRQRRRR